MQVGDRERDNHTISIDRYWHIVETSNFEGQLQWRIANTNFPQEMTRNVRLFAITLNKRGKSLEAKNSQIEPCQHTIYNYSSNLKPNMGKK